MLHGAEVRLKEAHIEDAFALALSASKSLPSSTLIYLYSQTGSRYDSIFVLIKYTYLVRPLDKSSNTCVSYGEDGRAIGVAHSA